MTGIPPAQAELVNTALGASGLHQYGQGSGFFDPGFGHVHIARNEGAAPVTVVQTYLNVPPGGSPRTDAPAPGNCPF